MPPGQLDEVVVLVPAPHDECVLLDLLLEGGDAVVVGLVGVLIEDAALLLDSGALGYVLFFALGQLLERRPLGAVLESEEVGEVVVLPLDAVHLGLVVLLDDATPGLHGPIEDVHGRAVDLSLGECVCKGFKHAPYIACAGCRTPWCGTSRRS